MFITSSFSFGANLVQNSVEMLTCKTKLHGIFLCTACCGREDQICDRLESCMLCERLILLAVAWAAAAELLCF